MTETWTRVCVLCAARGRTVELETGHCCPGCAAWLQRAIADIARLASDAAAHIEPASSTGGGVRSVSGSRPPLDLSAVDVENTPVPQFPGQVDPPTILQVLELAEREVRQSRGMAPYGPASGSRARSASASPTGRMYPGASATLVGCVDFLGRQVPWMTTDPTFGLEDFAESIRSCLRALRRWDIDRETRTAYVVECPHGTDHGTCGKRLRISGEDADAYFACPRCGTEWSVDRLMLVWAETSDASMWLDAEAVMRRYGVDRTTLARWVSKGRIAKAHGLYDIRPLALASRGA